MKAQIACSNCGAPYHGQTPCVVSSDTDTALLSQAEAVAVRRAGDLTLPLVERAGAKIIRDYYRALIGPKRALLTEDMRAAAAEYIAAHGGTPS